MIKKNLNSRYICASLCEPNVNTARVPGDATTETWGLILKEEKKPTCKMQREPFTDSDSHCSNLLSCIFHVSLLYWLWIPFSFICSSSTSCLFFFCGVVRVVRCRAVNRHRGGSWSRGGSPGAAPRSQRYFYTKQQRLPLNLPPFISITGVALRGCVCGLPSDCSADQQEVSTQQSGTINFSNCVKFGCWTLLLSISWSFFFFFL